VPPQTSHDSPRPIAAVAIAQFLLQFYREPKPGLTQILDRQLQALWSHLRDPDAPIPCNTAQLTQTYATDLEEQAANHVIVISILSATACVDHTLSESETRPWDRLEEIVSHLTSSEENDRWYNHQLTLLRGLPVDELKAKVNALNQKSSRSAQRTAVGKHCKRFHKNLSALLKRRDLPTNDLLQHAQALAQAPAAPWAKSLPTPQPPEKSLPSDPPR
jgi:hypothetical protein